MPKYSIITLFPELVEEALEYGVLGRAVQNECLEIDTCNPRDFSDDERRNVDDSPYGGGPGMVMQVGPLRRAIQRVAQAQACDEIIYLSPQGQRVTQSDIKQIARNEHTLFVCGRYEGIDQRVVDHDVSRELSIGDFVMSGGEFAALCVLDAVARLIPGVLGNQSSAEQDSFQNGLLDYPHYTRPEEIDGQRVPAVLLSGDHAAIRQWRRRMALQNTLKKRPDLLEQSTLDATDQEFLDEIREKT